MRELIWAQISNGHNSKTVRDPHQYGTLYLLNRVRAIDCNRFRGRTMTYKGDSGLRMDLDHGYRDLVGNGRFHPNRHLGKVQKRVQK